MKKRILVLGICIGLICSIFFVPNVSAEEGATITITIYKIGKEDLIENVLEGEADWSYRLWVYDGEEWQDSDWKDCTDDTDNPVINKDYYYTVYSTQIYFKIALKERDVFGEDLADLSSKSGGGLDGFTGTYPGGARYDGTWNLITNSLSGDQTDIVELAGENYYWTSGSKDGSESVDENDASLWFKVSDNYDSPVAEAGTDHTIYTGEKVNFDGGQSTASAGSSIIDYQWDIDGDGTVDYQTQITSYTYDTKGTYLVTLQVTDSLGQTDTDTCTVYVLNRPPTAAFVYSPKDYPHPTTLDTIQFTDTSTDSDGTLASWYWNFGDGETSTQQNPTHNYAVGGTYTVSLTITDNDDGSDMETKYITVIELATITGTVKDADGNPISGATIEVRDAGTTTIYRIETATTGTDGTYTISEIPTGTYDIEASKSGYNDNKMSYKTISSGDNTVDFVLTATTSEGEGTPGFEVVFAFLAMAIVIIMLSKRNKK